MATGKRLINARELLRYLADEQLSARADGRDIFAECLEGVFDMIADFPTSDAVEVVRCKDCKLWHEGTGWCIRHSHFIGSRGEACHPWESNDWKMLDADDFCSYGERKDDHG